jgi:hypothetical protein
MGGKDSGSSSSDFYASQNDDSDMQDMAMLEAMMGMMSGMTEAMATMATQVPEMPEPAPAPQLATTEPIDWAEKMSTLNAKTRADYANTVDNKKGRTDTIHTSPLLDEDETNTTSQTLIGS